MLVSKHKYCVFIISTSIENPEQIEHILVQAHFNVVIISDWQNIFETSEEICPDLILLDYASFKIHQTQYIRQLRRMPWFGETSFLFLISDEESQVFMNSFLCPCSDFISLPLRPEELIQRIHLCLSHTEVLYTYHQQNEKLKEAVNARDNLYSIIAHDLRAPIGTIKMINSTIENNKKQIQDPQLGKLFEMINETTEEAFNLLENLLRWTRNLNGKTKVYATLFNINTTIRQVASLFNAIASAKDISLNKYIGEDIYVYADEDMIKTVLRNLLSNAIKFTYPRGCIDINVSITAQMVLVSVKDDGQGIKKELQAKLLKENEYVTSYGTLNEKGSGLGLLLCRDFIKMNKGKFWFSSVEDKGSTFYFTIPRQAN